MGITKLPPELLTEAFIFATHIDPLVPLRLRCVCRWWRCIVDSSPSIWQRLLLSDKVAHSRYRALLWTKKSLPLPFDINLDITDSDTLLPHLSSLVAFVDRWRTVKLNDAWEVRLVDFQLSPASLRTLVIDIQDSEFDEWEVFSVPQPKPIITTSLKNPSTYAMNITLTRLPQPHLLTPFSFTHLEINESHFGGHQTHPFRVLSFLTMFPALQCFEFAGWPHDDEAHNELFPIVHLPDLHTLSLRNTCSARAILSHIYAPQLRVLYLYHLNVDFRLLQLGAGASLPEPGDSDDEANDYSQSPWSDHATGMGLRKLIMRCNPPIRVLEMDFSDMRTKDFKFVFESLPTLQEFMIVASDMSDTVINLLRPYRKFGVNEAEGGMMVVRLPALQRLELFSCQRLSGGVIVDALGSRVAYTDQHSSGDTLSDVSIVNCEGFTSMHGQTLSRVLGRRLRLD
ncbi:hypothetical protein AMATHDRAFT_136349 [Amanita thiersii Skay4041]|uniref:F-box domain-containing protein n=1 Tax=Amanita thiersii Skay4041 TaxID=703135 RepID=A0A2A9NWY7_9AGAR|nr:hypothetical protein AMATHDRAFT_136349 [Amanita thiersii Skay4041]